MTNESTPPKTGLVVIDVQKSVMEGAWQADAVVDRIAVLIGRAREAKVPVIYVQHEDDNLVKGSPGWEIEERIAPAPDDVVIAKHFPDSFAGTKLGETLRRLAVGHVVMAGAQTDVCIRTTTLRTLIEGYDLTLVEDCHTTEDATFDDVKIGAEQIVAHTNLCLWCLTYPGQTSTIAAHNEVQFAG